MEDSKTTITEFPLREFIYPREMPKFVNEDYMKAVKSMSPIENPTFEYLTAFESDKMEGFLEVLSKLSGQILL